MISGYNSSTSKPSPPVRTPRTLTYVRSFHSVTPLTMAESLPTLSADTDPAESWVGSFSRVAREGFTIMAIFEPYGVALGKMVRELKPSFPDADERPLELYCTRTSTDRTSSTGAYRTSPLLCTHFETRQATHPESYP